MTGLTLREAAANDFPRIIEINQAELNKTSAMDIDALRSLDQLASYHRVAVTDDLVVAFLLAIKATADYHGDNFRWFAERDENFLYVDRVVVERDWRGTGIGGALYRDLFGYARAQGIEHIACEYNIQPPNPASGRFHRRFNFRGVGQRNLANANKRVSMQLATPRKQDATR